MESAAWGEMVEESQSRIEAWTCWAWVVVATRPVPMALKGREVRKSRDSRRVRVESGVDTGRRRDGGRKCMWRIDWVLEGESKGAIPNRFIGDDNFGEIFSEVCDGVELVGYDGDGLLGFSLLIVGEMVSKGC